MPSNPNCPDCGTEGHIETDPTNGEECWLCPDCETRWLE